MPSSKPSAHILVCGILYTNALRCFRECHVMSSVIYFECKRIEKIGFSGADITPRDVEGRLWRAGFKPFLNLLAKTASQLWRSRLLDHTKSPSKYALRGEERRTVSGLRAFCLCQMIRQNAGSLDSHGWHANSPETVGTEEGVGLCGRTTSQIIHCQWTSCQPTAQSANDCQLHSPTHYSKSHCGAWLVTYQSFQCKPLLVSLHALGWPGYCQLKFT